MKRLTLWLLVVILVAGSIWAVFYFRGINNQNNAPEILRSTQINYADLTQTVAASGNLVFKESVDLFFRTSGKVASIAIANGADVKQDQSLATLDTSELERSRAQTEIALEQAELNLHKAMEPPEQDLVKLAQNAVNSAAQALETANLGKQASQSDAANIIVQAERARESAYIALRDSSDVQKETTQKSFDTTVEQEAIAHQNADLLIKQAESQWWSAYNRYKQAERSLEKLQSPPEAETIRLLELQVQQAQLNLEQAQQRIDGASITAPFDGVITQINLQEGVMQAGSGPNSTQPAMKLVDKSQHFIEISIDEIDIGEVAEGMSATIKLDAYPGTTLKGLIDAVAPSATNLGGIVNYNVSILITEWEDIILREGMTASAEITVGTMKNLLLIPNWAVRTDQETGETYCYRIVNGVPNQTLLSLGVKGDTSSSVLSGLEAGDVVGLVSEDRNLFNPDFRPDGSMRP